MISYHRNVLNIKRWKSVQNVLPTYTEKQANLIFMSFNKIKCFTNNKQRRNLFSHSAKTQKLWD